MSSKRQRFIYVQRRRVRPLLIALAAVSAVVGVTRAAASPPTMASGTFTTTSATMSNARQVGDNTIMDLTATVSYTGTFTGTSTLHGILIFHSGGTGVQFPPWRANAHDVATFTGTVNGVPGTVTYTLDGGNDPTGAYKATDAIGSATGDLAGLHGVLHEVGTVGPNGPAGTYTGQIQFGSP